MPYLWACTLMKGDFCASSAADYKEYMLTYENLVLPKQNCAPNCHYASTQLITVFLAE